MRGGAGGPRGGAAGGTRQDGKAGMRGRTAGVGPELEAADGCSSRAAAAVCLAVRFRLACTTTATRHGLSGWLLKPGCPPPPRLNSPPPLPRPSCTPAGLDWDELEEQAAAEDREKDFSDEDGEEYARKRKAKGGGGGGGGKKARR